MISRDDAWRAVTACAWYCANQSVDTFLEFFFDGEHHRAIENRLEGDCYVREWADRFRSRNLAELFFKMDYENQRRFIEEALRVYEVSTGHALVRAEAQQAILRRA